MIRFITKIVVNGLPFLLVLAGVCDAAALKEYRGREVTIRYEAPLEVAAQQIASGYIRNRSEVEWKLGWKLRGRPLVVLTADSVAFRKMAGHTLVTAFAVPGKELIVMDYSKMDSSPFDLRDTFRHELAHLLLHQNIESSRLPKWLDEGLAQWASGGMADIMRAGEKTLLQKAFLSGRMLPLDDINSAFPDAPDRLTLAYEESNSFIEFIIRRCGEEKLRLILRGLAGGSTPDQALHETCGIRLAMLEQLWREGLRKEYTWISFAAGNIYRLLYFLGAFAAIAAWVAARRRRKGYRDEEGEGDSARQGDGS